MKKESIRPMTKEERLEFRRHQKELDDMFAQGRKQGVAEGKDIAKREIREALGISEEINLPA